MVMCKLFNCISFTSGMEGDPDLQFLLKGGDLLKVRSSSWKKTRFFKLQEDCKTMWHESKKLLKTNQTCECCPRVDSPIFFFSFWSAPDNSPCLSTF